MDSINRQQPEDNFENLMGSDAVKKIKELAGKADTCFFCSDIVPGQPIPVRPMAIQQVDEQGNLWFLSAEDSHKNQEIKTDNNVQLFMQSSAHSGFLSLYGKASISKDKAKIKELWNPIIKTWFTGGVDDPRITVIKVDPQEGYYWDNKHGNAIALLKMAAGAIMGKTLDDSIEGNIRL